MTWVQLTDDWTDNPKIRMISNAAQLLWIKGLTYCYRMLTDGWIPRSFVVELVGSECDKLTDELVNCVPPFGDYTVGLWEPHESGQGWVVHDYLSIAPSAASVKAKRKRNRDNQRERYAKNHPSTKGSDHTLTDVERGKNPARVRQVSGSLLNNIEPQSGSNPILSDPDPDNPRTVAPRGSCAAPAIAGSAVQTQNALPGAGLTAGTQSAPVSRPSPRNGKKHPTAEAQSTEQPEPPADEPDAADPPPKIRLHPLPKRWKPSTENIKLAERLGVDVELEAEKFRGYALRDDRRYARWGQAFHNWLKEAARRAEARRQMGIPTLGAPHPQGLDAGPPLELSAAAVGLDFHSDPPDPTKAF